MNLSILLNYIARDHFKLEWGIWQENLIFLYISITCVDQFGRYINFMRNFPDDGICITVTKNSQIIPYRMLAYDCLYLLSK